MEKDPIYTNEGFELEEQATEYLHALSQIRLEGGEQYVLEKRRNELIRECQAFEASEQLEVAGNSTSALQAYARVPSI